MTVPENVVPLDQEEQDILDALEQLDAKNLPPPSPERQKIFREAAENFARKETSMNIQMDAGELEELKKRAARNGLRCQSFVKEILHKYITGQLVEKQAC